jgi:mannosyltransferase
MMQRPSRTTNVRRDSLWLGSIVLVGLALRLYHLGTQSLWIDEAFSSLIASLPLTEGLERALVDFVHPPLYYLLLRPVTFLSQSEFALRLPSALLGTLSIPLIYQVARSLDGEDGRGRASGLLAAGLLAINPFHIWYSREARNYQLLFFLALLLLYLFHQLLQGRKRWLAFATISALVYLTHYFAILLALVQLLYFVMQYRRHYRLLPRWILAQGAAVLPLGLWLIALFSQEVWSAGTAWIPQARLVTPLLTLWDFALLYAEGWLSWGFFALPLFALILLLGLRVRRRRTLLLLWLVFPALTLLSVSWALKRTYYLDRHLIISLPAFVVLLARGLVVLKERVSQPRRLVAAAVAVLLVASALSVGQIYWDPALAKADWRGASRLLEANYQQGDLVVTGCLNDSVALGHYLHHPEWMFLQEILAPDAWAEIEDRTGQVWLVWSDHNGYNHLISPARAIDVYSEAGPPAQGWLDAHRDQIVAEYTLPGIVVIQVAP